MWLLPQVHILKKVIPVGLAQAMFSAVGQRRAPKPWAITERFPRRNRGAGIRGRGKWRWGSKNARAFCTNLEQNHSWSLSQESWDHGGARHRYVQPDCFVCVTALMFPNCLGRNCGQRERASGSWWVFITLETKTQLSCSKFVSWLCVVPSWGLKRREMLPAPNCPRNLTTWNMHNRVFVLHHSV